MIGERVTFNGQAATVKSEPKGSMQMCIILQDNEDVYKDVSATQLKRLSTVVIQNGLIIDNGMVIGEVNDPGMSLAPGTPAPVAIPVSTGTTTNISM